RQFSVFSGGWTLEATEAVCEGVGCRVSGVEKQGVGGRGSGIEEEGEREKAQGERIPNTRPPTPDTLDLLASLADKSLVMVEEQEAELRYRMLETVREYGREKLQESGEEEAVRERHAEHYLQLAEQARPFLNKPELAWLDRLETEHDNLRAALTF